MPDIVSEGAATQAVFVPAVQSDVAQLESSTSQEFPSAETSMDPEMTPSLLSTQLAADADVVFVEARLVENNSWTFSVTVSHPDTGWEDYADGWDVVLEDGEVIKPDPNSEFTRLLLHPHENEQPFTRSQSGIEIPSGTQIVIVRAHDIVDGFGGEEIVVYLTKGSGRGFEVHR